MKKIIQLSFFVGSTILLSCTNSEPKLNTQEQQAVETPEKDDFKEGFASAVAALGSNENAEPDTEKVVEQKDDGIALGISPPAPPRSR